MVFIYLFHNIERMTGSRYDNKLEKLNVTLWLRAIGRKYRRVHTCTQGVRNKGSLTGIFFFSSLFLFFREAIGRVKRVCDRLLTAYKEYEHLLRLRNTFKGHVSWNNQVYQASN